MTRIHVKAGGVQKHELQKICEEHLQSAYSAIELSEGKFEFHQPLTIFSCHMLVSEFINILCKFGPDTFYSNLSIESPLTRFHQINFGLGRDHTDQIEWEKWFIEKHS